MPTSRTSRYGFYCGALPLNFFTAEIRKTMFSIENAMKFIVKHRVVLLYPLYLSADRT